MTSRRLRGAAAAPIVERAEALHAERAPYAFASASAAAANDDAARHRHEAQCAHFSRVTLAGTTIPRVDARSLTAERFAAEYMEASPPQPVVLTHALDAWPALTTRPWCDTGTCAGVRRAARARRDVRRGRRDADLSVGLVCAAR